jgi:hypothetical protein
MYILKTCKEMLHHSSYVQVISPRVFQIHSYGELVFLFKREMLHLLSGARFMRKFTDLRNKKKKFSICILIQYLIFQTRKKRNR